VAVIAFINSLKIFDEIYIMTKGGPADASKSTAYFIYEAAFTNGRFGYSAAAAVVLLIVGLVGTAFMLRLFEGGGAEEGAA
jgi:putative chitobiose transport system permease protein